MPETVDEIEKCRAASEELAYAEPGEGRASWRSSVVWNGGLKCAGVPLEWDGGTERGEAVEAELAMLLRVGVEELGDRMEGARYGA